MDIQQVKQRFGIIGNSNELNRAIDIAVQVSPTDLTVLITGESGTGKEIFPRIIHQYSARKHGQYIAVNCGAIPEGTIDSELFGHEKGAFTGAHDSRKGYFESANNGTIFLDEVGELPLSTQVRLLRVLETGEFMKVGASKTLKTNVRVIAATNVNVEKAVEEGKFREDLYYRLNTVPILMPALRERKNDIYLLFRKFSKDSSEKYRVPNLTLTEDAIKVLENYRWPGNIRQLKNITEQISILEKNRTVDTEVLKKYLPIFEGTKLPAIYKQVDEQTFNSEREILYKIFFDMRKDVNELKQLVNDLMIKGIDESKVDNVQAQLLKDIHKNETNISLIEERIQDREQPYIMSPEKDNIQDTEEFIDESLSLIDKEKELIIKALEKHRGKRKYAAIDLGISERTLYRKIKEYNIDL